MQDISMATCCIWVRLSIGCGMMDAMGLADRLEVYYAPKFGAPYLDLKVSAIFHFDGRKYCGCRQMVSLNFNLEKLLRRNR